MRNHASLRRGVRRVLGEHATTTARKAISGADISDDVKQLEMYGKLLGALPRSRFGEMYPAILIAAACLLAASVAWTIRVPTAKVHLSVRATAVSMRLASALAWQGRCPAGGSLIRLREFGRIELPPELGTAQRLTQRAWLDISGGAVQLTRLDISQDALVRLMRNESGEVDILTLSKPFQGQLDLAGSPRIAAGDPPGTVTFYDAGRPANPSLIRTSLLGTLQFRRVAVYDLSLFTETPNAQQESLFASSITEGALTMPGSGTQIELKAGDPLYLEGARGLISELEVRPDSLGVMFDGEAHGVSLGAPGLGRNLKPTILEYLYHREKIGFFWGAVTFVWGLLWSGRKLFSA